MPARNGDRTPSGRLLRAFRDTRAGLPEQAFVAVLAPPDQRGTRSEHMAEARIEVAEDPDAPGKLLVTVRGRRAGDVRVVVGAAARAGAEGRAA